MSLATVYPISASVVARRRVRTGWRSQTAFTLFLLTNVALFLRPTEVLGLPSSVAIYFWLLIASLVLAVPDLARRLSKRALAASPVTVCVLALPIGAGLSQLTNLKIGPAIGAVVSTTPLVVHYLLLVSLVDSPRRLIRLTIWLAWLALGLTALALLGYHGVLTSPELAPMLQRSIDQNGTEVFARRLCGPGIFHDPNDMCLVIVPGIAPWTYRLFSRRLLRPASIGIAAVPLVMFYGLLMTQSRGGFLALLGGMTAYLLARFGWRRMLPLGVLVLPLAFVLFAGRQTSIDLDDSDNTAQTRIQLWSDGLQMFRESPLFGTGYDTYSTLAGLAAHNSFLHCYTELGFLGGTLFLAAFFLAICDLYRLHPAERFPHNKAFIALRPALLAAVCGYAVGLLALSRSYVAPTYLMLALAVAYVEMKGATSPRQTRLSVRLVGQLVLLGAAFLLAMQVFVKLTIRWGA